MVYFEYSSLLQLLVLNINDLTCETTIKYNHLIAAAAAAATALNLSVDKKNLYADVICIKICFAITKIP